MTTFHKGLLISFLLSSTAFVSHASDKLENNHLGIWTVSEVYCRTCKGKVSQDDVGKTLTLEKDRVTDPLSGGSCPNSSKDIGYRVSPLDDRTIMLLNPKWLKRTATRKDLKKLYVTCDKMAFLIFVKYPDGNLVRVGDGDIVQRLEKK